MEQEENVAKTFLNKNSWLVLYPIDRDAQISDLRVPILHVPYLNGQFTVFGNTSLLFHVIDLNCAIRLWVASSNDINLTSYDQFGDLITHHVIIRVSSSMSWPSIKKSRPNPFNPDVEVCRQWNAGRCTSESCKYHHVCLTCGQKHQAKSCGRSSSSEGTK